MRRQNPAPLIYSLVMGVFASALLVLGLFSGTFSLEDIGRAYELKTSKDVVIKDQSLEDLINSIEIYDGDNGILYDRKDWERPVKKFDGKSIRNYSLSISDNNVSKNNVFKYLDPYTDGFIEDTAVIDYDHIIPLHYVHKQVGDSWSNEMKNQYTFDISNGVNTHRSENRGKGSKGPSQYMPEKNQEEYAYSWLVIANQYGIPLRSEDMKVIKEVLKDVSEISSINTYRR